MATALLGLSVAAGAQTTGAQGTGAPGNCAPTTGTAKTIASRNRRRRALDDRVNARGAKLEDRNSRWKASRPNAVIFADRPVRSAGMR